MQSIIQEKVVEGQKVVRYTLEDYVLLKQDLEYEIISNVDRSDANAVIYNHAYLTPMGMFTTSVLEPIKGDDESEEYINSIPNEKIEMMLQNYINHTETIQKFDHDVMEYSNKNNFPIPDITVDDIDQIMLKYNLDEF